jgi:hypothetical protein
MDATASPPAAVAAKSRRVMAGFCFDFLLLDSDLVGSEEISSDMSLFLFPLSRE